MANQTTPAIQIKDSNVGIGTASPTRQLELVGTDAYIQLTRSSTSTQATLGFNTGATNDWLIRTGDGSTSNLHFYSYGNSSYVMTIARSSGNVGIGTTAPNVRLDVQGDGIRIIDSTSPIVYWNNTVVQWKTYLSGNDYRINNGSFDYLTIKNDTGNVGIGTTAPGARLEVSSNATLPIIRARYNATYHTDYDSNGIQFVGTGQNFNITDNGSSVLYLKSGGNVGIGTTSPNSKLEVAGNIRLGNTLDNTQRFIGRGDANSEVSSNGGSIGFISTTTEDHLTFNTHKSGVSQGERMRITSTGNVLIGTTADTPLSTARGIVINSGASNDAQIRLQNNTTGSTGSDGALFSLSGTGVYLWNYENDAIFFGTNNSTRITITSAGNVGIGLTNPSSALTVVGDVRVSTGSLGVGVTPNATDGRIDASNDIVAFSTSDRRLKENITPIANALEKVRSLTGVEFDWKEETKKAHGHSGRDTGVIAQEVQAIMPTAVRTNNTGYLAVRYEKLIGLLIEGMKEQQAQIDELKAQINDSSR